MTDRIEAAIRELVDAIRDEAIPPVDASDRLLSVDEAADVIGCGRSLTYTLIGEGRLRSIKVGRRRLIPASAVAEFVGVRPS